MDNKDLNNAKISEEELKDINGGASNDWQIEYQKKLQEQLQRQWEEEARKREEAEEYARKQQQEWLRARGLAK
ncbi:MAG: hypothetical protein IJT37_02070 [Lachnospiraceae bacterium]|nr:hypothetical protein [Lachnospiraceae bacterium]